VPYIASLVMSPSHISPYLLAYPAVILSAWMWGLPGVVACASVAGATIEHFIFAAREIDVAPTPREPFRLTVSVAPPINKSGQLDQLVGPDELLQLRVNSASQCWRVWCSGAILVQSLG